MRSGLWLILAVAACKCDINIRFASELHTPFLLIPKSTQLRMYGEFVRDFNKEYSSEKFFVFQNNLRTIADHNSQRSSFKLGINFSADMTFEEFRAFYLMKAPQDCSATGGYAAPAGDIPDHVDWRDKGMVSPVKNQLKCGSCWTFSTTGALEAHAAIKFGKKFFDLAEQQLVDCAGDFDNNGCSGGLPSHAFTYLYFRGGIQQEADYPYHAVNQHCVFDIHNVVLTVPGGSVNITAGSEPELTAAIANEGPVSIAFEVVDDFRFYKSGVYFSDKCKNGPQDVNHAVLAVGYGNEDGHDYYIVKNSWSETWGDKGYFKILRGSNMCGLANCNAFPKLVADARTLF